MTTDLAECLPANLRDGAAITRIGAGLSGAGVYRVVRGETTYVLKVARPDETLAAWQHRVDVMQSAASAGVAPRVVHVDAAKRATVTEHVTDRSFPAFIMTPATRPAAIQLLAETLRQVHALPVPAAMRESRPREALVQFWSALSGYPLPPFVGECVARVLDAAEPAAERTAVLCHNDVNPSNLVFDGERLLLLDWDTAAVNDPLFDIATVAMFLRFDDATCAQLLSLHDGTAVTELPARLRYLKRLVAVLCGCALFGVARRSGHPGSTEGTLESAPSLVEVYQRMRGGTLSAASPDGQWQCALALVQAST